MELVFETEFGTARLKTNSPSVAQRLKVPMGEAQFSGLKEVRVETLETTCTPKAPATFEFSFAPSPETSVGIDGGQYIHSLILERKELTAHITIAGDDWWDEIQSVECTIIESKDHTLTFVLKPQMRRTLDVRMAFASDALEQPIDLNTWLATDSLLTMELPHA